MIRVTTLALTIMLFLALAPAASAHVLPRPKVPLTKLSLRGLERFQERSLRHAQNVVRWFERHPEIERRSLLCVPATGADGSTSRSGVAGAPRARGTCASISASARQSSLRELRWHRAQARWVRRELLETRLRLAERDWLEATEFAGHYFGPGAQAWLRSCSQPTSEGGWGRFVMNTQGSGAGGWLQFMYGTWAAHVDAAFADARRRGLELGPGFRSWYSRVGQAVTGAHMWSQGLRWHWQGWGC